MISIRDETTRDQEQVREVTASAFRSSPFGHNGEAELIDTLRTNCDRYLSLVACSDDRVVGHILFTPVVLRGSSAEIDGMGLAPMAVEPLHQRSGIGSSLVTTGLNRLFDSGCPFVVVLGHPDYYVRFGFSSAAELGIVHGFHGITQDAFFVALNESSELRIGEGKAYYRREFGPQHVESIAGECP